MKSKYKLDTGLRSTYGKAEFETDEDAWENLRKIIPRAFAILFKETEILVPCNNAKEYCENYNSKYGPNPIGYGPDNAKIKEVKGNITTVWIPVLEGITSHEFNVK